MSLVAAALLTTVLPMLVGQRWVGGAPLVRWSLGAVLGIVFVGVGVMLGGLVGFPEVGAGAVLLLAWFAGPAVRWTPAAPSLDPTVRRLLLLVGGIGLVLLVLSTMRPVASWDGWFMWSLKAKSLAAEGTFATSVFLGEVYEYSSQDYPPLLYGWQALAYRISGDLTVSWPLQFQQAWLWLAAGIALVGLLSGVSRLAVLLPFAWLTTPQVVWESMQGYADVPMALQLMLGTIILWHARDNHRAHVLAGVLFGGAALTKTEGLPLAAIVLVCLLVLAGHGRHALIAPAVVTGIRLPWLLWTTVHGISNHMIIPDRSFSSEVLSQLPERVPLIWSTMGSWAVSPLRWGLLLPACVAAMLLARRADWRLLAATVLAVLLFTTVYALWPYRSWTLESYMTVNVDRVLISCLGLLSLCAALTRERRVEGATAAQDHVASGAVSSAD